MMTIEEVKTYKAMSELLDEHIYTSILNFRNNLDAYIDSRTDMAGVNSGAEKLRLIRHLHLEVLETVKGLNQIEEASHAE